MNDSRPWLSPSNDSADCDAAALIFEGTPTSRSELAGRADALARWLGEQGIHGGDVVAALLPNGVAFAALLHAVDRRGAVLLPLNARQTPVELAPQVREAGARLLVHGGGELSDIARTIGRVAGEIPVRKMPALDPASAAPVIAPPGLDAPLAILYTSGTTGRPKGAVLSHANFRASAAASAQLLASQPDDRWLACMPLFHVGGLSILLRSAVDRIPVVLHERFDAAAVNDSLGSDGITIVSLVPTMLNRLIEVRGDEPLPPSLRCVLLGGSAAPQSLLERATDRGWPVATTYGLTEAASQVATLPLGADPLHDGLEPLPGTEIRIVTADGHDARPNENGEIAVRGATVIAGYHERPEQSREALRDGWLFTGDIGCLDATGRLHVLERRTDLIVSGGENVSPAEVETVLQEHPAVADAGVTGVPDPDFGQRPAAWLVVKPGESISDAELTRFCRERLAGYKIPVRYHRTDELPRTASGKLQRADLPERPAPAPRDH